MTTPPSPRHTSRTQSRVQPLERAGEMPAHAHRGATHPPGGRAPWALGLLEGLRRVVAGGLAGAAAASLAPGWELPLGGSSGMQTLGALFGACAAAGLLRARRVG